MATDQTCDAREGGVKDESKVWSKMDQTGKTPLTELGKAEKRTDLGGENLELSLGNAKFGIPVGQPSVSF